MRAIKRSGRDTKGRFRIVTFVARSSDTFHRQGMRKNCREVHKKRGGKADVLRYEGRRIEFRSVGAR